MKLTRLRLVGFKSFVDASELVIQPGLTGVVGPNGCGKSNLVEALRWAMGESSHKALRAAEMNDVIFAGSGGRPSRNTAEVVIALDNSNRLAPAPFTEQEELEISRRIERDKGSTYRVNGREVRARDVQLLFADASTGARSPALVRQGQIGEIINARPEARRRVLEEAAGIAGLHARRHESELKLRAAEQNLDRVEDVLGRMQTQLEGLKRQARQAVRYRQLSADIRRLESLTLARAVAEAIAERDEAVRAVQEAERQLATATLTQGEAARIEAVAAHELPTLRDASAAASAALERIRRAGEDLDREEKQARERLAHLIRQIAQLDDDREREKSLADDAAATLARFEADVAALDADEAQAEDREAAATKRVAEVGESLAALEAALAEANAALAARTAERDTLSRARNDASSRAARLSAELQKLDAEAAQIEATPPTDLAGIAAEAEAASAKVAETEATAAASEIALAAAREREQQARGAFQTAESELRRYEVEARTLSKVLDVETKKLWPPVIDKVSVKPGYEAALAAALGEDLTVPDDTSAPIHWGQMDLFDTDPALPDGATPLSSVVDVPPALARRLAQIGIVARADARRLQSRLSPGQRLVSVEGDLWRWDGFVATAESETPAARRLAGRNRLKELEQQLLVAIDQMVVRKAEAEKAQTIVAAATREEQAARDAVRNARRTFDSLRERAADAERQIAKYEARRTSVVEQRARVSTDAAEAQQRLAEAEAALSALTPAADLEGERDRLRISVERERTIAGDARAAQTALAREREGRVRQREAIARDRASWETRLQGADDRLAKMEERRIAAETERAALDDVPEATAAKRRTLMLTMGEAEIAAKAAADRLAEGESKKNSADTAARDAIRALGDRRASLAREETRRDAANERLAEARRRFIEATEEDPDIAARSAASDPQPLETLSNDLARLKSDRDRLGAVNLRAEDELTEVQQAYDGLVAERDDLIEAIKRLRQGIQSLNREGRDRLSTAFDAVNAHFVRLFATLFGGGEAKLELIESDDPLEAGLEVIARPPGKRPQTLSLLSGGEQALTAMALIFAIFLTNPAPLCVLDEVDAPLDDANVERFCDLLEAMRGDTDTRFLVVTHNPVTMSRMDRLFGVTMAERGVSQLVSVDLEAAERLREAV
ncbi:chromosome segregation SMC family protein [Flaviflagellibacter deserti]|uniref:Chromosome partition protein Smc n=1 Tax=Flaviflagellibacter deserti TaxID=2267266 RepID=A0ABV9YXX2_9HYPH